MFDMILTEVITVTINALPWILAGAFLGYSLGRLDEKLSVVPTVAPKASDIKSDIETYICDIKNDATFEIYDDTVQEFSSDIWSDIEIEPVAPHVESSVLFTGDRVLYLLPAASVPATAQADILPDAMSCEELIAFLRGVGVKATKRWRIDTLRTRAWDVLAASAA